MKNLLLILIFLSFLQASILPFNFILIILICRSFLMNTRTTLYLGFGFGLLLSFLLNQPLGILALIYLLIIFIIGVIKNSLLSFSWPNIFILSVGLIFLDRFLEAVIFKSQFDLWTVIFDAILILPTFLLMIFLSNRFSPVDGIKLKLAK